MGENFFDFQKTVVEAAAAPSPDALSVSQLTQLIEKALRSGLPATVAVRGEISNFKHHTQSGHGYFTLKDAQASIDCVMFRPDMVRLKFQPQDGLELLAVGRVAVYPSRGRYQLYVSTLQPLGKGALELAFRQLHAKLEAQGLFAAERKKPLPQYPARLALVTSTHTAALKDMLKVLAKFPWLTVMVYHVPVQGEGAAAKIAAALAHLNRRAADVGGVDVILLGRGGGSLEDLWAFNEEAVARAVAASAIPVITGIGHEVDVSIADLTADYHAHTPTEAAQVAVRNSRTAADTLDSLGIRLRRSLRAMVQESRQRLTGLARQDVLRRPMDRINLLRQTLDDQSRQLALAASARLAAARRRLAEAEAAWREHHPRHLVALARQQLLDLRRRLQRGRGQDQARRMQTLAHLDARLNAVSPLRVLQRGYSITTLAKTGRVVRQPADVTLGARVITRLADGEIQSVVEDRRQLPLFPEELP